MAEDDDSTRELYEQVVAALRGITGQKRRVSWYEMQIRVRILGDVEPPVAQVFERLKLLDLADAARNRWATALDAYDAALRDARR
jgi:hypothetical protein